MFVTIALAMTRRHARGQTLDDLVQATGRRKSDLRKVLVRLEAAGIVREPSEEVYQLTDDFVSNYERSLELSGITYAEREQKRRHADDRERRDAKLPIGEQPRAPLMGKEKVTRLVAEREREDRRRWVAEQRRKVGTTALTFLADEVDGRYGVRFKDAAQRWRNLHGGSASELWQAIRYGPFVLRRIDGFLFIDPVSGWEPSAS